MNSLFKFIVQFWLKWCSKIYLWRIKPHAIIIAGTTNRYWVKEAVVEALKEKNFPVRTNKKNFNAEIGLPLSILDLPSGQAPKESPRLPTGQGSFWGWLKIIREATKKAFKTKAPMLKEFLVLEMAIDKPEGINYLLSIIKPNTLILTTVTMIYAENFENLDEIAFEYKKLIKKIPMNGLAILNFDDERIKKLVEISKEKVISYGFSRDADFNVKNVRRISTGEFAEVEINPGKKLRSIKINRFGNHHVYAGLVKEIIKENFKVSIPDFFKQMQAHE